MQVKSRCLFRMKPSPSKSMKTVAGKKRSREEAAGSAVGSTLPASPPRPNPNKERKKSKAKTEDLLALLNSGFLREEEVDMWRAQKTQIFEGGGDADVSQSDRNGSYMI
jgi:hypothetical protein